MTEAKRFPRGCVASPQYLASAAGLAVLAEGGNAVDAAVATSLTLGVVASYMCGYGGDLFCIVWKPGEALWAYNGSGRSGGAATVEAARAAIGSDDMPRWGPHSVTVPGAVEGWFTLLDRFGSMPFERLARDALRYAREGYPTSSAIRRVLRGNASGLRQDWAAEWRRIYGEGPSLLEQTDLARTIETLMNDGPDAYYRGPIAQAIGDTLTGYGALITADDLAAHTGNAVSTIATTYRDSVVHEMPPNTQGLAALEALNIVEEMDLGEPESLHRHHVLIEAMKLAMADRDEHITDLEHMRVAPDELASKAWAASRRAEIDMTRASMPVPGRAAVGGTIYLCAADADGMLVSLIQSNFAGFGSYVTVPGWGINLQNRGAYFSLDPDHVNVIAPSKRTMHTLIPAMVFRDGAPWLVFGSMGGDGQPQTHLQVLTRVIDDGMDIQEAIDAPRWAVSPTDWAAGAESRFDAELLSGLEGMGHTIRRASAYDSQMGHAHAIEVTEHGYACATDPRAEGAALGL